MEINIYCTMEEYNSCFKEFDINKVNVIKGTRASSLDKRIIYLKKMVEFDISREHFFRKIRRNGYSFSRTTFIRDLNLLEADGVINLEVNNGGRGGSATMIRKGEVL